MGTLPPRAAVPGWAAGVRVKGHHNAPAEDFDKPSQSKPGLQEDVGLPRACSMEGAGSLTH